MIKNSLFALGVLCAVATTPTSAGVITFSEANVLNSSFLSSDGEALVEWVWSTGLNDGHSHLVSGYEQGHGQLFQGVRISSTDADALTLDSFDMRGNWLVSLLNDGTGTSYTAGTAGAGSWTTQAIGLTSFSHIYIYANGSRGDLDNIVFNTVSQVPEPASLALISLALLGVAVTRKRSA